MFGLHIGSLNIYVSETTPVESQRASQALRRVGPNNGMHSHQESSAKGTVLLLLEVVLSNTPKFCVTRKTVQN